MLNPIAYRHDTEAFCGRIIDHSSCSLFDIKAKQKYTSSLWESEFKVMFEHTHENSIVNQEELNQFESKLSHDLMIASWHQKNFYYQVSLPHFKSFEYLTLCLDRYKKFLFLKNQLPNELVTPCIGIEVIWQSHLLCPNVYENETTALLGKVLPHHADLLPDKSAQSRPGLERITQLWREIFDEDFFFPGGMYRGDRPIQPVFSSNNDLEYDLFFLRNGSIKLSETTLTCKNNLKNAEKTKYRMMVTQNRRTIYDGELSINEVLKFCQTYTLENFTDSSLNLRLAIYNSTLSSFKSKYVHSLRVNVRYRETIADKLANTFKYLPKHDNSCDIYFDPRIIAPEKGIENQYFSYALKDPRGNEFNLNQRWRIETRIQRCVRFGIIQGPFQAIDMKYIFLDYDVFDLHNRDFSGQKGEGIRAQHTITSMINNYEETLFTAEILHIVSLQWSSVRIMKDNQVYATSHLIGPAHLPPKAKIKYDKLCLTLESKDERAVLVRNIKGDYAILIGKWIENKDMSTIKNKLSKSNFNFKIFLSF